MSGPHVPADRSVAALLRLIWRRSGLKARWVDFRFAQLRREWLVEVKRTTRHLPASGSPRVLLIPPDPLLLTSSRGDEAMLLTIMRVARERMDSPQFVIATASDEADARAQELGALHCRALDEGMSLAESASRLSALQLSHCVTVGADVFDGSYDPLFTARLLMLADVVGRQGVTSFVNGFSFSTRPYSGLAEVFKIASANVKFKLRDPVSLRRFAAFSHTPGELTADIAFMLPAQREPSGTVLELLAWVSVQRAQGRVVLGLNIHPLLLDLETRDQLPQLVRGFVGAVEHAVQSHQVSVVLLEHDFRGPSSDRHCLDPLEQALGKLGCAHHIYRQAEPWSAAAVKQVVGHLDGVATGRMHLAIATLGSGVPVVAYEYKGKMEGLLAHFGLDRSLIVTGPELLNPESAKGSLIKLATEHASIRRRVQDRLQQVLKLSAFNLAPLCQPSAAHVEDAVEVDG